MRVILQFEMRVSAPTKTTTGISLECLGVKVERTAGSVQRAVEDALSVFGHELRKPLLKEARDARAKTSPLGPRTIIDKDQEPEAQDTGGALPETFVVPPSSVPVLEEAVRDWSDEQLESARRLMAEPGTLVPVRSQETLFGGPAILGQNGYISGLTKPGEPPEGASAEPDPTLTCTAGLTPVEP